MKTQLVVSHYCDCWRDEEGVCVICEVADKPAEVSKTCDTCKWWGGRVVEIAGVQYSSPNVEWKPEHECGSYTVKTSNRTDAGRCKNPKLRDDSINESHPIDSEETNPDGADIIGDGYEEFVTGPKFGCIHHQPKE